MQRFQTHVVLISDQMIPNATPVMDNAIRPENVILCVTDKMKEKTAFLRKFFEGKGIKCETFELGNTYQFDELKDRFLNLAVNLDARQTAINLTGGTKLMTIAALTSFEDDFACFYVIPEVANILMINRKEDIYTIHEQMKLEDFFAIHGYKVKKIERGKNISSKTRNLCEALLTGYQSFKEAIGTLNSLAMKAEENRSMKVSNDIPDKSWELLKCFYDHGAIKYYDDKKIEFKDNSGRKFCQGFWLEDYVYLTMAKAKNDLQDYASSVVIESPSGTCNEIDAAFLRNNQLHLIECKTANMRKNADALYKIDSIHNLSGIFTKPVLVTYRPFDEYNQQRAKDLNIKLFEGECLKNLETYLIPNQAESGK
jgi:hypothetical protein